VQEIAEYVEYVGRILLRIVAVAQAPLLIEN